jgi:hypothetical protein
MGRRGGTREKIQHQTRKKGRIENINVAPGD